MNFFFHQRKSLVNFPDTGWAGVSLYMTDFSDKQASKRKTNKQPPQKKKKKKKKKCNKRGGGGGRGEFELVVML